MKKIAFRVLAFLIPIMLLIACELPASVREPTINDAIEGAATQLKGESIAQTAQALATVFPDEELLATASSLIKPEENKLAVTLESFSVREGGEVKSTLESFTSNEGKQYVNTLQAMVQNEQLPATLEAYLGEIKEPFIGDIPEDIPIVDSRKVNKLFKTPQLITYSTSISYDGVIAFYKNEMPNYGWNKVERGTTELDTITVLKFNKENKETTVSIYKNILGESTIVLITITKH